MTQSYIPSGLGETVGLAAEATVGTFVTPARWIPHKSAPFSLKKKVAQSEALQGSRFKEANRRVLVSSAVTGSIEYELADRQFGLILAHCIGSTATAVDDGATPLYVQNHVPGFLEAQSLSVQKGVPFTSGQGIQAFSYNGVKIVDWTIECSEGGIATLALTIDAWAAATSSPSYTAPTYLSGASAPNLLNWGSGSLVLGGTVSTSEGVTTVSGAEAPVGLVKSISVKGTNVLDVDRYTLGSQVKAEQLTNGFSEISGEVEIEFANLADFYTAFVADTATAIQVSLLSPVTATGGYQAGLVITIPSIRFEGDTPNASGPGVISVKVPFTGLLDSAGDPIIQLAYTSTDTSV
jgi:hypothetical protein